MRQKTATYPVLRYKSQTLEQLAVSLSFEICPPSLMYVWLLCTRLRNSYGRRARGGPSAIKNRRALDTPSFSVTRRLLAAARIWLMLRAPLEDHLIPIPPRYVEGLRAQFLRMFVNFVAGSECRDKGGKWHSPSCPVACMQNIEIQNLGEGQEPAIIFPGGPNFHAFGDPLVRPKPVWTSDDVPDDESDRSDVL